MYRFQFLLVILLIWTSGVMISAVSYRYYCSHVTAQEPWINIIQVFNNGDETGTIEITIRDESGSVARQQSCEVPPRSSVRLVMSNFAGFVPEENDLLLDPVEGTFFIDTDDCHLRPKISFRYGDSESLCEFFLEDTLGWEFVLPNTVENHFSWTGMSIMNPLDTPLSVTAEAYLDGQLVGESQITAIPPGTKFVRFSEGFWGGLGYSDFDQVRIYSCQAAFPPPMAITGNDSQDRHLFFNAALTNRINPCGNFKAGDLYATDSIVGELIYVPAGTFQQGHRLDDPCRISWTTPFTHTLTRSLAVMATEVTQQMWADLQWSQLSLPVNPSSYAGNDRPVECVTWYEALLFANLLSIEQGFTPCYYKDAAFTTPLVRGNHTSEPFYCNWDATGYRLPAEAEWEYFCRAGTTASFSIDEPNFVHCSFYCRPGDLPFLETVAWFCANRFEAAGYDSTKPVAMKDANPWGLYDVHGNVREWSWDWFDRYYPSGPATDYHGPDSGTFKVIRGGGWTADAYRCISAERGTFFPFARNPDFGFRLCRTVE